MTIWLINDYNMLPEHGQFNRNFYFCKNLKKYGHNPIAFVGSHPHNTDLQLINGTEKYRVFQKEPFLWVLVKTDNYEGSKIKRIVSMFKFYKNMKKAAKNFEKPDVIIGSSAHPLAALLAIKLGKKYRCGKIVEIRDLWPESLVAYGMISAKSIVVRILRKFEKWLYSKADSIVFTMEGAYDYIIKQKWENEIPKEKVFYVNNGVDIEQFDYNLMQYQIDDKDLNDPNTFKVVYSGSIRKANDLGRLLDAAKLIESKRIVILIWGDGDEVDLLRNRIMEEGIDNVKLKGRINKKYVPYILSKADVNLMHGAGALVSKYGLSANKLFEYFAAGRPVFTDYVCPYNPACKYSLGMAVDDNSPLTIANGLDLIESMDKEKIEEWGKNARIAALAYDYDSLTQKLLDVIGGVVR